MIVMLFYNLNFFVAISWKYDTIITIGKLRSDIALQFG